MNEELKCGCGGKAEIKIYEKDDTILYFVECKNCAITSGGWQYKKNAITAFSRATRQRQQGIQWISVKERVPEYIDGLNESGRILIYDRVEGSKSIYVGEYILGEFIWWSGSFCNIDLANSQKSITHWAEINLPESEVSMNPD